VRWVSRRTSGAAAATVTTWWRRRRQRWRRRTAASPPRTRASRAFPTPSASSRTSPSQVRPPARPALNCNRSIDSETARAHAHTSLRFVFWRGRAVRARAGIMFNDITALLLRPDVFKDAVDMFVERYRCMGIAAVAGTESNLLLDDQSSIESRATVHAARAIRAINQPKNYYYFR
jgi:hypothetical protein